MNREVDPVIGTHIRERRRENGVSRGDLAHRISVPLPMLRKVEAGAAHVRASTLCDISQALHVPPLAFFASNADDDDTTRKGGMPSFGRDSVMTENERNRLLRAFARIRDHDMRLSAISLIEAIADADTLPEEFSLDAIRPQ